MFEVIVRYDTDYMLVWFEIHGTMIIHEQKKFNGFYRQVKTALEQGYRNVLIDLTHLESSNGYQIIDSAGLGELIKIRKAISDAQARIVIINKSTHIEQVFQITHLATVFPIFNSYAKAHEYSISKSTVS